MTRYLNKRTYESLIVGEQELLKMHESLSTGTKFILSTFCEDTKTITIEVSMKCLYYDEGPNRNYLLTNKERKKVFNAINGKIKQQDIINDSNNASDAAKVSYISDNTAKVGNVKTTSRLLEELLRTGHHLIIPDDMPSDGMSDDDMSAVDGMPELEDV